VAQDLTQIAAKALVLDANIVLRAVLGTRVRLNLVITKHLDTMLADLATQNKDRQLLTEIVGL
jgi:hypothetical protein